MSPAEKRDAIREIEEALRRMVEDYEQEVGHVCNCHAGWTCARCLGSLALSLLPRLRAVVEAAEAARDEAGTHTISRDRPLDSGFGRIYAALDGPLAALRGEEEKP